MKLIENPVNMYKKVSMNRDYHNNLEYNFPFLICQLLTGFITTGGFPHQVAGDQIILVINLDLW